MRRVLAITLLLAFASSLAVPLFAAAATDPEASLPPCCRSHGKHHCAMMHMMLANRGPVFTTPPCPFYPTAINLPALATAMLAAARPLMVAPMRTSAPPIPTPRRAFALAPSANLNRGPPRLA